MSGNYHCYGGKITIMSFARQKPCSNALAHTAEADARVGDTGRKSSITASLRSGGVQDILSACCDGLNGFENASLGQRTSCGSRIGYYE
jgi:hypothetical protein